jgi:hypothetical protein
MRFSLPDNNLGRDELAVSFVSLDSQVGPNVDVLRFRHLTCFENRELRLGGPYDNFLRRVIPIQLQLRMFLVNRNNVGLYTGRRSALGRDKISSAPMQPRKLVRIDISPISSTVGLKVQGVYPTLPLKGDAGSTPT